MNMLDKRKVVCVVVVAAVAIIPTAAASAAPTAPVTPVYVSRVVLVGDSLAQEIAPALAWVTAPRKFVGRYLGGTAPCDWTKIGLNANQTTTIVISFTGNSVTRCMSDGHGGFLGGAAVVDKYRKDLSNLISQARRSGARVVLAGQASRPADQAANNEIIDSLNVMYRELASAPYVSFVDAGAVVENDDGTYAGELPCESWEATCNANGMNTVRGDGVHFCPVWGAHEACPVYSSGAVRYALVLADAATRPQAFE